MSVAFADPDEASTSSSPAARANWGQIFQPGVTHSHFEALQFNGTWIPIGLGKHYSMFVNVHKVS